MAKRVSFRLFDSDGEYGRRTGVVDAYVSPIQMNGGIVPRIARHGHLAGPQEGDEPQAACCPDHLRISLPRIVPRPSFSRNGSRIE